MSINGLGAGASAYTGTNNRTSGTSDNKPEGDLPPIPGKNKTESTSNGLFDYGTLRKPSADLGKDAFMQILIAQLANQDPMEPMKDNEFIAQMAQFSSLEQMQQLNQTFANSQAQNMVGKYIVAETFVENSEGQFESIKLTEVVTGVVNNGGKTYLVVGKYVIDPASVSEVYDMNNIDNSILQSSSLIGQTVTAKYLPEGSSKFEDISGKVTNILVKNGAVYAYVDGKEVPVGNITSIGENPPKPKPEEPGEGEGEGGGETGGTEGTDPVE